MESGSYSANRCPKVTLERDIQKLGEMEIPLLVCPHDPKDWFNIPKVIADSMGWVLDAIKLINSQLIQMKVKI